MLSKQAGTLRASLLLSLGLVPIACGGTVVNGSHGEGGNSAQAGAGDAGGSFSNGGSPVVGADGFLRWALSVSSTEARHELASEAARQLADFESDAQQGDRSPSNEHLASHGLLGQGVLRAIHLAAVRDVSRPLLASLFEVGNTEPMKESVI